MKNKTIYFCLLLILIIIGCSQSEKSEQKLITTDSTLLPDSELFGATTYLYDGSRKTTQIKTGKIIKYEKLDSAMAYQVNVLIFDSLDAISSTIVGDSGLIKEKIAKLELFSNVVVVSNDSIKLETEHLFWNSKTQKIESDVFVKITKDGSVTTGVGLEADKDLYPFKILNASGVIQNTENITE
ncbi:MAG: LPS export ABC transporter periplasmic protein LptC [candidate division Zixibacteria bacterium]|nr:LPS export ABC transporter periplasmic protein LptC [candidate division Zixibacteria bacterium]